MRRILLFLVLGAALFQADCAGVITGSGTNYIGAVDNWQLITATLEAPAETESVRVRLAAAKPFNVAEFRARFDNVLFR